jgi:hypothetical protein
MTRRLALTLAVATALIVSASVIKVGTSGVGIAPAAAAAKSKMCKSKMPSGKLKTWRCAAEQPCCVNHALGLYVCGFAGMGSLGCI